MKGIRTVCLLFILLLCIVPVQAIPVESVPFTASACGVESGELTICTYTLEGTRRVPLSGASFTLRGEDGASLLHITTGKTGTVTLSHLPAGSYRLEQRSAPLGYRPLSQPLELQLLPDGTVLLDGRAASAANIFHRHMPWAAALWLLLPVSLLPALLRIGLLYRQHIFALFVNFSSLVHLSQSFTAIECILTNRKGNPTPDGVI